LSPDTAGLHRLFDALARFRIEHGAMRPTSRFDRAALAVVVTTSQRRPEWEKEAGKRGALRLVLIDREKPKSLLPHRNAWLALDADSDCTLQLQHQWERVCHDSLAK
jgi:hypothetical protein